MNTQQSSGIKLFNLSNLFFHKSKDYIRLSDSFDLHDTANLGSITINLSKMYEKLTESFQISPKYILIKKFSAAKITIF